MVISKEYTLYMQQGGEHGSGEKMREGRKTAGQIGWQMLGWGVSSGGEKILWLICDQNEKPILFYKFYTWENWKEICTKDIIRLIVLLSYI